MPKLCTDAVKLALDWGNFKKHNKVCANAASCMNNQAFFADLRLAAKYEPANDSVKQELQRVASLIEKGKNKVIFIMLQLTSRD